jgi:hypothetical protein
VPPVAFPPEPIGAYVGQDISKEMMDKIAAEGARTVPGREHGGNCDASNLKVISQIKTLIGCRRLKTCRVAQDVIFRFLSRVPTYPSAICISLRAMYVATNTYSLFELNVQTPQGEVSKALLLSRGFSQLTYVLRCPSAEL